MNLHSLPQIVENRKKRLGRGHGSGKVKTSGRGTKGTKARYTVPLSFEGAALPLMKRIPFLRGKSRFKPLHGRPLVINVSDLSKFEKGSVIDEKFIIEKKIFTADEVKKQGVKILGDGELKIALTVNLPTSKSAKQKIKNAGGIVEVK
jgi:large subunit ribosomal protein L15